MTFRDIRQGKILIIDDEKSLRQTFEMLLSRAGYTDVTGLSSFQEARDAVTNNVYDLIISDIVLEGATGIDLLSLIRERGNDCPVVMITGFPNIETAAAAVRLGAFDYLPKPVKKDALLDVVARALHERYQVLSARKKKESHQKSLTAHQQILQSVKDIIITLAKDKKILAMNPMASSWAAENLPDLQPNTFLTDIQGEFAAAMLEEIEYVNQTGGETMERKIDLLSADDGAKKSLILSAAPLKDKENHFLGVVITAREQPATIPRPVTASRSSFHNLVGQSDVMQKVYSLIENVSRSDATVLISGESGTGKELVAEAIHRESDRRNGPFVKFDCTAIPENIMESELFGHLKGSFTGATSNREGRLLQANGGTLFLDEIGDISSRMQLRFLRFLQEKTFYPVGHDQPVQVDVRVITATNADLKKKVEEESFREDLYFRLRVVDVMLPPLRERGDDIMLLAYHFVIKISSQMNIKPTGISDQAAAALLAYNWPGNVRELEHVMERACVLSRGGTITTDCLPPELGPKTKDAAAETSHRQPPVPVEPATSPDNLSEPERITQAIRQAGGNKAKAARMLGIDRSTLYRKMQHYKITLPEI